MSKRKTIIVTAALFVLAMGVGLIGPRLFPSKPDTPSIVPLPDLKRDIALECYEQIIKTGMSFDDADKMLTENGFVRVSGQVESSIWMRYERENERSLFLTVDVMGDHFEIRLSAQVK